MTKIEPTLRERTGHLYRQLLLLQHLFQVAGDSDDADWLETGDRQENIALCTAIRQMLCELTEHARVLTSIPMPIGEWRPGDTASDDRWRPLTELERREILALLATYESLVSWSEQIAGRASGSAISPDSGGGAASPPFDEHRERRSAIEYLRAERAKITRFRQEMAFLERRKGGEARAQESSARVSDRPPERV